MRTVIYYFTGTGNSLAVARLIAERLEDTELIPIASLRKTPGLINPGAERVGIVCPVYDAGVPVMVGGFAERLDVSGVEYLFAVVNFGGTGVSALHQLNEIFSEHRNRSLDGAFSLKMPGNFPPVGRPPSPEKADEILNEARYFLDGIARDIACRKKVSPGFSPLSSFLKYVTYGSFSKNVHRSDENFTVSDKCTSCRICEKVCPVGNISIAGGRPEWHHRCQLCCACLNLCPKEAIDLSLLRGTKERGRYRHPDLKISDMEFQKETR